MEQAADLVQLHVGGAVRLVVGHGAQQARDERAAHLGLVGDERVHEDHRAAAALLGHADLLEVVGSGKGEGRGLVEAAGAQDLADLAGEVLLAREAADVVLSCGNGRLDAVHAPQAQDFLDEVDLAREVGAEARRHHVERVVARRAKPCSPGA